MSRHRLGIDRLLAEPGEWLGNKRFALITGSANVDSCGRPVFRLLKQRLGPQLRAIWSLQHGFMVDKQDNMILSDSFHLEEIDVPVCSLYGQRLLPEEPWLDGIEAVVVDLFDVGTRVYTFLNQAVMIMKCLVGRDIEVIVPDRPNPLGGRRCEGNAAQPDYFSIVAQLPVPMRHGLTAAEYLAFAQRYFAVDVPLRPIPLVDWRRSDLFSGLWTYPSPNMPSFNTAAVYPGAVLLEGTGLSEGRGTTRPFELLGAPYLDAPALVEELGRLELPAVTFVPLYFKPEFSKYAGQICRGILVVPGNLKYFAPFETYYEIIRLVRQRHPHQFRWKQPPYEFEYERLPIDMICGSPLIRQSLEQNRPFNKIAPQINHQITQFHTLAAPSLLY
jgi:uncharacterized protein YbbC (DUF1343 family)